MLKPQDLVILYHNPRTCYLLSLPEKGRFSTHKGEIDFAQILEREYGDLVTTHTGVPFYLLRPTWADLELKVRRTTTIIYPKDAGLAILKTRIGPGSKVGEVGTGSGALTLILAGLVRPDGRVYSYEARPEFVENARWNLTRVGLIDWVELRCRNVATEGLDEVDLDAVFLDLAQPWEVLAPVHKALKPGNSVVILLPTIEQVQRTVSTLETTGFVRIEIEEVLERALLVRPGRTRPKERMVSHTGYLIFAQKVKRPKA